MAGLRSYAAMVVLALAAPGCATMSISSHVERGLDVAQYRTYDWGPADALPIGDPRLDQNPFFKDHILGAVEKQMAAKGFERSTVDGRADLLIHYHAVINTRLDVNRIDQTYGYCFDEACRARVVEYEAGTLVLDIVDGRTNRVIWRGWAQDTVERILNNEDRMARQIDEAVRRMLARFPRPL
jgi:hypothetical protein